MGLVGGEFGGVGWWGVWWGWLVGSLVGLVGREFGGVGW